MGRKRSAFHRGPESFHSNEGRIHLRRPTLSLSFFACNTAADHTWKGARPLGHYLANRTPMRLLSEVAAAAAKASNRDGSDGPVSADLPGSTASKEQLRAACAQSGVHTKC